MKEQIEEMAKSVDEALIHNVSWNSNNGVIAYSAEGIARELFDDGYRKQKHGTWYHGTENGAVYAKCSACGRKMNYSCYGYAYCCLCGARMDGAKMKGGAE